MNYKFRFEQFPTEYVPNSSNPNAESLAGIWYWAITGRVIAPDQEEAFTDAVLRLASTPTRSPAVAGRITRAIGSSDASIWTVCAGTAALRATVAERDPDAVRILTELGLSPDEIERCSVLGQLPVALAESFQTEADLKEFSPNIIPFEYDEES